MEDAGRTTLIQIGQVHDVEVMVAPGLGVRISVIVQTNTLEAARKKQETREFKAYLHLIYKIRTTMNYLHKTLRALLYALSL